MAQVNGDHASNGHANGDSEVVVVRHSYEAGAFVKSYFELFAEGNVQHAQVTVVGHAGDTQDTPACLCRWGPPLFQDFPSVPVNFGRNSNTSSDRNVEVDSAELVAAKLSDMFQAGVRFEPVSVKNVPTGGDGVEVCFDTTHVEAWERNIMTGEKWKVLVQFYFRITLDESGKSWAVKRMEISDIEDDNEVDNEVDNDDDDHSTIGCPPDHEDIEI